MLNRRPRPPHPDRIRIIRGSFSWIDHRFLRLGFDQGLSRLEKLFYFVLITVSNCDGVSFYSDERLAEILEIRQRRPQSRTQQTLSVTAGDREVRAAKIPHNSEINPDHLRLLIEERSARAS